MSTSALLAVNFVGRLKQGLGDMSDLFILLVTSWWSIASSEDAAAADAADCIDFYWW